MVNRTISCLALVLVSVSTTTSCCAHAPPIPTASVIPTGLVAYRRVGQDVEITYIDPVDVPEAVKERLKQMIKSQTIALRQPSNPVEVIEKTEVEKPQQTPSPLLSINAENVESVTPENDSNQMREEKKDQATPLMKPDGGRIKAESAPTADKQRQEVSEVIAEPPRIKQTEIQTPASTSVTPKASTTPSPRAGSYQELSTTMRIMRNQTEPSVVFETTQRKPKGPLASSENSGRTIMSLLVPFLVVILQQILSVVYNQLLSWIIPSSISPDCSALVPCC